MGTTAAERKKILIVEDSVFIAEYINRLLVARGFSITAQVSSGSEAIDSVGREAPDLILMDILLEGELDGIDTVREIKKTRNVPVIYLTGNTEEPTLQRAKLTEPHGYLIKPVNEFELISGIETALYKFKIEQASIESEKKYRSLFESSMDAIMLLDQKGFIDCNHKTLEMFGFSDKTEFISKHPADLSPPRQADGGDSKSLADREIMKAIASGSNHFQWIHRRKNGVLFHAEVLLSPVTIDGRGLIQATVRDISERIGRELEIKKAQRDVSNLLSSINSILIGVSTKDEVTHWNFFAEEIFGFGASEIIGKKVTSLPIRWEWDKIYVGIFECVSSNRRVMLSDINYTSHEGKEGILGIMINLIRDIDGNVSGFLIYGNDITEKRVMEFQLLQDQKLKSMGELAAGIAHEINTPAQYISGNTVFCRDSVVPLLDVAGMAALLVEGYAKGLPGRELARSLGEKLKTMDLDYLREEIPLSFQQSLEGLEHISRIVGSMKGLSHPGDGEKIHVDVNKAVNDAVTISQNEWKYVAEMKLDLDDASPEITGYPAELNQVLLNLIVNAAHTIQEAIESGRYAAGAIEISSRANDSSVEIIVRDNGMGIPERIKNRIFDPFFTTKEIGRGTGQGLAIVHSIIVRKYGGTIRVDTKEGRGSSFIIKLPGDTAGKL